MKILFLTPQLPYPPTSGGTIKTWKLVRHLSERYTLTLACLLKGKDCDNLEAFSSQVELASFYHEPLDTPRTALNLARSYLHRVPLTIFRNRSTSFSHACQRLAQHADLLFIDHYLMFQYLPATYRGPVILHTHNAEHLLWQRLAEVERRLPRKLAVLVEGRRILRYERQICRRADVVLAAPNDIQALQGLGLPPARFRETYHLGEDPPPHLAPQPFEETEPTLLYVGTLTWEPNIDGLIWLIDGLWSKLKARHPTLRFTIIGRDPDPRLAAAVRGKRDIELLGFVPDPEPYYRRCRLFMAPLRFGSGMKVKVISAMGRGIPTVTTSVGVEGLEVTNMEHVGVADDLPGMERIIDTLLTDPTSWGRLQARSRQLIEQRYSWSRVFSIIDAAIDECKTWRP